VQRSLKCRFIAPNPKPERNCERLLGVLALQVLVCTKCQQATDKQDAVHGNAEASITAAALAWAGRDLIGAADVLRRWIASHTLQCANQQTLENLARFIAVSNILEGFGGVLAANVEENFFAATVEDSQ
jgi:hypothetical protein